MGKIIGTQETLDRVKGAKAGDKSVYINYEAVKELPDEFDIQISKVEFDIDKDFSEVTKNEPIMHMPNPALMYLIAEAKGISGQGNAQVSPIYENVNIDYMDCKDTYRMMNMIVGYRCTKQSAVLAEDGTLRFSSPCTVDFNVWNRCSELWSKEEMYSEGYTKSGKYSYKYDSKYKRRAHFNAEIKFAAQKAETKAFEKTIRELAGLMTGYTKDDLKEGAWYFARVRRSNEIMKLESAARLTALERGDGTAERTTKQLFGPSEPEERIVQEQPAEAVQATQTEVKEKLVNAVSETFEESDTAKMSRILESYMNNPETAETVKDWSKAAKLIDWLNTEPNLKVGKNAEWFKNAVAVLKEIEDELPKFMLGKHDFY